MSVVRYILFLAVFLGLSAFVSPHHPQPPEAMYLTWEKDPCHTMTIQWLVAQDDPFSHVKVREEGAGEWKEVGAVYFPFEEIKAGLYRVQLEGLKAGRMYEFQVGNFPSIYRFQTLEEKGEKPIRFVTGGDIFESLSRMRKMHEVAASLEPDFVVLGGDVAYSGRSVRWLGSRKGELKKWGAFFKEWKRAMIGKNNRVIPLLVVIGNHDLDSWDKSPITGDPLFYRFFCFPDGPYPYRVVDVGGLLSLFFLDTGHSYSISAEQTKWLGEALAKREGVLHKIPVYHKAAYPSVYAYEGSTLAKIREHWVPLFEKYGVKVAFENHNHGYKRTYPLKGDMLDPDGVVYLGDGCWGVRPRAVFTPGDMYYLAKSGSWNHVFSVTVDRLKIQIDAIDIDGKVRDQLSTLLVSGEDEEERQKRSSSCATRPLPASSDVLFSEKE